MSGLNDYTYKSGIDDDLTARSSLLNEGEADNNEMVADTSLVVSANTEQKDDLSFSKEYGDGVVSNAKIISLSVDKLTAGSITSQSIELAVAAGTGDVEIRSGIAAGDFANVAANSGFILGVDDSDSDKAKLYIGSATSNLIWDGTNLTITGGVSASTALIGALTLGNGTTSSGTITMNLANTQGDCYIAGGTFTATTWTAANGFILGIDDSDSNKEKFFIGSAASSMDWNVTTTDTLTVIGTINATAGYIGSATSLVYESQGINTGINGWIRGGQSGYDSGTGYFLGYSGSAYKFSIGNSGDTTKLLLWDGTDLIVNGSTISQQQIYGDGSDGDVTTAGNVTLSADVYANNYTIAAGHTVTTNGWRLFVKGTLTIAATGQLGWPGVVGGDGGDGTNDADGTGGTAGTALTTANYLYGSLVGKAGGKGGGVTGAGNGTNGSNGVANSLGNNGTTGGAGGAGATGPGTGSTGGTEGTVAVNGEPHNAYLAITMIDDSDPSTPARFTANASSGSGGGGGGGSTTGGDFVSGGGGGGGSASAGGIAVICARIIVNAGSITVAGGKGGDGGDGTDQQDVGTTGGGGGGGGAPGNGGVLLLVYNKLTNTGTITVAAGAIGAKGLGGTAGVGTNGTDGDNSGTGSAGLLIQLEN